MGQPLLLEGEPGVGKTEAAKALAGAIDTPLIRLQCYEGLTSAEALYEWNYPRQLLAIRLAEARHETPREADLFGPEYLLARPLLAAIEHPGPRPAVLLIDEIDRGDDEFEAFLFELLAESAVTIPELGTRRATFPPVVVLTSNRTRDLHDALKRRCLYHWIDYPSIDRVAEIIRRRVPGAAASLAGQVANGVARLRGLDLAKPPGVAEAISWTAALHMLGAEKLDETGGRADRRRRAQVRGGPAGRARDRVRRAGHRRWLSSDLAEVAARFGAELRRAGLPVGPGRSERFANAVTIARPQTLDALYRCALATLVSSRDDIDVLRAVFSQVFGGLEDPASRRGAPNSPAMPLRPPVTPEDLLAKAARAAKSHVSDTQSAPAPDAGEDDADAPEPEREIEHRYLGSTVERLAGQDFAELSESELALLVGLMRSITLAVPMRRSRRERRRPRRAAHRPSINPQAGQTDRRLYVPAHLKSADPATTAAGRAVRHIGVDGTVRAGHDPAAVLRRGRARGPRCSRSPPG